MKTLMKFLATALFLTGALTFLNAQIGIGARGGVTYAEVIFDNENDMTFTPDYNLGLTGGIVLEIGLMDYFSIQPEINFIQKGYKLDIIFGDAIKYETKTYLNYVEIPLLLKGKFGNESVKGFVMAGPSFGYAFDGITKVKDGEDEDVDFDNIKRADLGLQFGVGAGVAAGPGTLFLDGRYGLGLTDLNDIENAEGFKNSGFNVGIGYILTIAELW